MDGRWTELTAAHSRDQGFGALLHRYRRRAAVSQSQLADLSTVSVRTIRYLESGKVARPRLQTARLLAEALSLQGVPLQRFLALAASSASELRHGGVVSAEQLTAPTASGGIFGREMEMSFLLDQLGNRERFINVSGVTGVGKTRLLLELARRVNEAGEMTARWGSISPAEYRDGVRPFTEPVLAHAPMGLRPDQIDPAELGRLMGGGITLLLLDDSDNAQPGAAWLNALLSACPSLKIVAASRAPLHVPGKGILPLEPLAIPERDGAGWRDGQFAGVPSVQLLVSSIRRIRPSFRTGAKTYAAVAEICELLDGLPLALEQAAFHFFSDSPQTIAGRLRHDPFALPVLPAIAGARCDIRASLQDAIGALNAPLADTLRRLGKIDGDWSVREASHQFGWDLADLMGKVYELRLHGLLRCLDERSEPRFRVLRLIRQLALR
jgi:transcriptional regulator with XRE-family HTH domain